MSVENHDAYVIKTFTLNEADRVATLLTAEGHKLSAIAKNGARLKSAAAGKLEPFNFVSVDLFHKEGQGMCPVNQVAVTKSYFKHIAGDMKRFMVFSFLSEVVDATVHGEEGNPRLYRLLTHCFEGMDQGATPELAVTYFQFWVLRMAGMWPQDDPCGHCGNKPASGERMFVGGGFRCGSCGGSGLSLPDGTGQLIQAMQKNPLAELTPSEGVLGGLIDAGYDLMTTYVGKGLKSFPLMRPFLTV